MDICNWNIAIAKVSTTYTLTIKKYDFFCHRNRGPIR